MGIHTRSLAIILIGAFALICGCVAEDFPEEAPQLDGGDVSDAASDAASDASLDAARDAVSDAGDDSSIDTGDVGYDSSEDADATQYGCQTDADCADDLNRVGTCDTTSNTCSFDCEVGYEDCDGDDSNGCEAELGSIDHCSGCGDTCSPSADNFAPACDANTQQCTIDQSNCAAGHVNLNGDNADGCECTITDANDLPDADGEDTNCDGFDGIVEGPDANVVFVDTDGADNNTGLTPDSPLRRMQDAIDLAEQETRSYVLATGGSFREIITLKDGVSIFGAYDADNGWKRNTASRETIIEPEVSAFPSPTNHYKSVTADGLTEPVVLDHVTIRGVDASTPGGSTYALWVRACDDFAIHNTKIIAGVGGDGAGGSDGLSRSDSSCNAAGGPGGEENTSTIQCSGTATSGAGGDDGTQSGSGGPGGNGGAHDCPTSGSLCDPGAGDGGTILNGADGQSGSNGTTGTPHGMVVSGNWSASLMTESTDGDDGGGGGGGGAGGDCEYVGTKARGGAGGHGGAGGCGALRGENGINGGGSFGIFVTSSTIDIDTVDVELGMGGRGGTGGDGGTGQTAPDTGWTAGEEGSVSGGAKGGDGGFGGDGGHGGAGAGGCGGPTIGIATDATTATIATASFTRPSQGAQGGAAGTHRDAQVGDAPAGCTGALADKYEYSPAP